MIYTKFTTPIDILTAASREYGINVIIDLVENKITVGSQTVDCTYQPIQEAVMSILTQALNVWANKPIYYKASAQLTEEDIK